MLLKNDRSLLPLDLSTPKKVAVIGENAVKMMTVGGGSSSLKVRHEVSPLEGLKRRLQGIADVSYARGYVGDPTGEYNGVTTGQDLRDDRSPEALMAEAVDLARNSDYVIFVGGLNKAAGQDCEDSDRSGLGLPYGQDALIEALAKANPNLVVVNVSGNAVAMPWVGEVPAIVQAWFLGSEAGNAIASVLTGDVNPSGKLPMTFPVRLKDVGAHALGAYPGVKRVDSPIVDLEYKEGILVGYRWADTKKVKPLFPFGHGLSFTEFTYGNPVADKSVMTDSDTISISLDVSNTGRTAGAETIQLYISDPKSSVIRPDKELKGFQKVFLQPGESKTVRFSLNKDDLSYFDAERHEWVAEPGVFIAKIGASSGDIRKTIKFKLK